MLYEHVKNGVLQYAQTEIINKAQGSTKFLLYTGLVLLSPKLDEMYKQYKDNAVVLALDIIKDNDDIDVDKLYMAMKEAINNVGKFELMGVVFNHEDVESLYRHIKKQGGVSYETQAS